MAAKTVKAAKKRHPEVTLTLLLHYHPYDRPIPTPDGFDSTFYPPGMETVPKWAASQYVSVRPTQTTQSPRLPAGQGRRKGGEAFRSLPVKAITSKARATPGEPDGAGTAARCGTHRKDPYRRVKGRCWGNGLGSLVTCRHRLLAPRRHAKGGLTYSRAGGEQQGGHAAR